LCELQLAKEATDGVATRNYPKLACERGVPSVEPQFKEFCENEATKEDHVGLPEKSPVTGDCVLGQDWNPHRQA